MVKLFQVPILPLWESRGFCIEGVLGENESRHCVPSSRLNYSDAQDDLSPPEIWSTSLSKRCLTF